MTLSAGTRLGPYEILAPLGAGGMGEVYRARDTRLGREVAIKVLPAAVAADPGRLSRFEKEARSASALNHPAIVTIHDVGESSGVSYIAMELVTGQTLRELLSEGPLPARRILPIAAQVADGLARAHEAGIVHRDLKPENVMVTRDGFAKILDFGLAKLTEPEGTGSGTQAPTVSGGTQPGIVMGTVGYMSPEQAVGKPLDFRSDQFSFGSILYEMATGKRAFSRGSAPETLSAIIREEPEPMPNLAPASPAFLCWIVERCLAKNPRERYASTEDLGRDFRLLQAHLSEAPVLPSSLSASAWKPRKRRWLLPLLGGVVAAVAVLSFLAGKQRDSAAPLVFRRLTFQRGYIWSARFAPDGRTVVYGAAWGGEPVQLYSTREESPDSLRLPLPSADVLAVSSLGEMAISLGRHFIEDWVSDGKLARVGLSGNAPREVLKSVLAADWSPDGGSLAVVRDVAGRNRLEYPIGRVLYETAGWISHPRVSPKGDRVAFLDHPVRGRDAGAVAVVDRIGKKTTLSTGWANEQGLAWSRSGEEVWFTASTVGFSRDLYGVTTSGRQRMVARVGDNLTIQDISREGRVLLKRDRVRGRMVGLPPGETIERDFDWLDVSLVADLSADGTLLLFEEIGAAAGTAPAVYLRRTDGSPAVRLGEGYALALSPDESWALASHLAHHQLILLPTGAGEPKLLETGSITDYQWATFLPDGQRVLVAGNEPGHGVRLYVQQLSGGAPRPISEEGINAILGGIVVSPDGMFAAAIGPTQRILLYPLGGGAPRPVSGVSERDVPLQWSSDGSFLYVFQRGEFPARVFRLDVSTGSRELWKELMPSDRAGVNIILSIRLTPDGRSYYYSYGQGLSQLDLVEGLR